MEEGTSLKFFLKTTPTYLSIFHIKFHCVSATILRALFLVAYINCYPVFDIFQIYIIDYTHLCGRVCTEKIKKQEVLIYIRVKFQENLENSKDVDGKSYEKKNLSLKLFSLKIFLQILYLKLSQNTRVQLKTYRSNSGRQA